MYVNSILTDNLTLSRYYEVSGVPCLSDALRSRALLPPERMDPF
jgi:hypothetical protein